MKPHLPIKLLQAVMAAFVSHALVSATWAEDLTYTVSSETAYNSTNYDLSYWRVTENLTVSGDSDASLSFTGVDGPIIKANHLLINNLGDVFMDENTFESSSYATSSTAISAAYLEMSGNGNITLTHNDFNVVVDESVSSSGQYVEGGLIGCHGSDNGSDEGVSVRIVENGNVTVEGNSTYLDGSAYLSGGVIYAQKNVVISDNTGLVKFSGNETESTGNTVSGGVVYAGAGSVYMERNAAVELSGNKVIGIGGATAAALWGASYIQINDNGAVDITGNTVEIKNGANSGWVGGGAIMTGGIVNITGNDSVNISDNGMSGGNTLSMGGAIASMFGVNITDNSNVAFSQNAISGSDSTVGGAIASFGPVSITRSQSVLSEGSATGSMVVFDENRAEATQKGTACGGAIYSNNSTLVDLFWGNSGEVSRGEVKAEVDAIYPGMVTLSGHDRVEFLGNYCSSEEGRAEGGAIYASTGVVIQDSDSVSFKNNYVSAANGSSAGGAIYSGGYVTIAGNNDVTFSQNWSYSSYLDANCIVAQSGDADGNAISIVGNGNVSFENNYSHAKQGIYGGVLRTSSTGNVLIAENTGNVKFNDNVAIADSASVCASVIESLSGGIAIRDNDGVVEICNNSASAKALVLGGTMFAANGIQIDGNGGVLMEGNIAGAEGGAVGGVLTAITEKISISNNKGEVIIRSNGVGSTSGVSSAAVYGGAIAAFNGLSIVNNSENVTFEGNFEVAEGVIALRSIYVQDGDVELSAVEGKNISFYDSIRIEAGSGSAVALNTYTDEMTGEQKYGTGAIVFSGAKTADGLLAAQERVAKFVGVPLEQLGEIPVDVYGSRLSTIARDVSVEAGSLQVVDGAMLGLLDDGALGYDLTVGAAELVVSSGSAIGAQNIVFGENSSFVLEGVATLGLEEVAESSAMLLAESVTLTAGMTITVDGAYADLMGLADVMVDVSNGGIFTLDLKESSAIERDGMQYFVIFTGAKSLGGATWDDVKYEHNLTNHEDVTMGYDVETGTLYVRATPSIPEPATATLSLLALISLAARRRRAK